MFPDWERLSNVIRQGIPQQGYNVGNISALSIVIGQVLVQQSSKTGNSSAI